MAVYPSNMAPIGVNLQANVFQTIPGISFFGAKQNFSANSFVEQLVFQDFGQAFEEVKLNRPQNQIRCQILLKIDQSWGLYGQTIMNKSLHGVPKLP